MNHYPTEYSTKSFTSSLLVVIFFLPITKFQTEMHFSQNELDPFNVENMCFVAIFLFLIYEKNMVPRFLLSGFIEAQ